MMTRTMDNILQDAVSQTCFAIFNDGGTDNIFKKKTVKVQLNCCHPVYTEEHTSLTGISFVVWIQKSLLFQMDSPSYILIINRLS